MANSTSEMSKVPELRSISMRSSMDQRRERSSLWSTVPSRMTHRGWPMMMPRSFLLFSSSAEKSTSKQASSAIESRPLIIGEPGFSIGIAAMLETIMVVTSSDG